MVFISFVRRLLPLCAGALTALPVGVRAQDEQSEAARRVSDVASIALAEYAQGVTGGRVVQIDEFNEARLFLAEARRAAERLAPEARGAALPLLTELEDGANALRPQAELQRVLAALRVELERATGANLDPLPKASISLYRGAALYRDRCSQCHGDRGGGDGPLAAGLDPPVANLADDRALGSANPLEFFRKINVGVAATAMPGFGSELGLEDRWALALYASTLRHQGRDRARGRDLLGERCADCSVWLSDFASTARLSDDSLGRALSRESGLDLGDARLADAVAYGRAASAQEYLGGDRALAAVRIVRRTQEALGEYERLLEGGDRESALRQAVDAYLIFEGIESAVRARDARAAREVEQRFAELRAVLAAGSDLGDWRASRREVEAALVVALDRVTAKSSGGVLFGQSLLILLREGLEAMLIIGALVAFLTKAGVPERKREIGMGVLVAVGASVVTAIGFATLFRSATAHQEALEGMTMLIAAAVLFWVSYWLVSKIELRKWQAFVRSQMQRALNGGRAFALAAVAFLAVYREGFETVLFYAALFTTSDRGPAAAAAVASGLVVGAVLLAGVYFAMQRYGVRLPLKPFFAVTSGLLYLMAFSFAGQGVAELQEAGIVSTTPLAWLPSVPFLGIFPTIQTFLGQLLLALALVGALGWVFWLEPRTARARAVI